MQSDAATSPPSAATSAASAASRLLASPDAAAALLRQPELRFLTAALTHGAQLVQDVNPVTVLLGVRYLLAHPERRARYAGLDSGGGGGGGGGPASSGAAPSGAVIGGAVGGSLAALLLVATFACGRRGRPEEAGTSTGGKWPLGPGLPPPPVALLRLPSSRAPALEPHAVAPLLVFRSASLRPKPAASATEPIVIRRIARAPVQAPPAAPPLAPSAPRRASTAASRRGSMAVAGEGSEG